MTFHARADLAPLICKLESITRLSDRARSAIESLPVSVRVLDANQHIVRDKDRPTQCCLILEGWAYRYKLLSDGKRQILSFHVPGDLPDMQSLHLHVMDHNLATLKGCRIALVPHASLRQLIRTEPDVAAALWRETLVDAAIFREWMTGIGRRTAYGRIAHLFCEMYLRLRAVGLADDLQYGFVPTQGDVADALGLSNVHVNRVLQTLRSDGLVSLRGHKLAIRDWRGLTEAAEFDPVYLHLERPETP